jgi:hypothetical protein
MSEAVNPKDLLGVKKVALHLVPPALVIWVSEIFKFSAKKYGPYNWREKAVVKSIYLDAIERHLLRMKDGEWIDPESGKPHAAHIGANVAIILDADFIGNLKNDMMWVDGPATSLMHMLEEKDGNAKISKMGGSGQREGSHLGVAFCADRSGPGNGHLS